MKRTIQLIMIIAVISSIPSILCAQDREWTITPRTPDYTRPIGEAGSASNPYQARERLDGNIEIRSRSMDLGKDVMAPGQPINPWIVKPR
jgi:hypothetical protein